MNIPVSTLGILCLVLAILGGNVQIKGVAIKQLSLMRLILLAVLGAAALTMGLMQGGPAAGHGTTAARTSCVSTQGAHSDRPGQDVC